MRPPRSPHYLRQKLDDKRFPLAPRLDALKAILAKLEPPALRPSLPPPLKPDMGPSHGQGGAKTMITGSEPTSVFKYREVVGQWCAEKFDDDGGCEVKIFMGPGARAAAVHYAIERCGTTYVEKCLEPYQADNERLPRPTADAWQRRRGQGPPGCVVQGLPGTCAAPARRPDRESPVRVYSVSDN